MLKRKAATILAVTMLAAGLSTPAFASDGSNQNGNHHKFYKHHKAFTHHKAYTHHKARNTPSNQTAASNATSSKSAVATSSKSAASYTTSKQLPPGVSYDTNIKPAAGLNADYQTKFNAVLQVAKSKLGTPYVWGHSEDRGQSGFDCSNYTAYVYHHALGYKMSSASRTQASSVGTPVAKSQMRAGDLLIFDGGHHVGIYIGNGQMIQEGGGLKKVGYLKVAPGSYWYNHLTSVKRMF